MMEEDVEISRNRPKSDWVPIVYELVLESAELNLSILRVQNHLREVKEKYNALIIEYNKDKQPKSQRKWWHFGK